MNYNALWVFVAILYGKVSDLKIDNLIKTSSKCFESLLPHPPASQSTNVSPTLMLWGPLTSNRCPLRHWVEMVIPFEMRVFMIWESKVWNIENYRRLIDESDTSAIKLWNIVRQGRCYTSASLVLKSLCDIFDGVRGICFSETGGSVPCLMRLVTCGSKCCLSFSQGLL